ncbi:Uncharacterised protein [Staphylococcus aureus]|nr:Uncharacterised protein [Staphylococcus aureus]CAC7092628.1 Uncharacterised protein [Staphylococcus aureus]SCU55150.1 Uncharacterised protein [Staphylococcus aureus]
MAVSAGLFQYPGVTFLALIASSPISPVGTSSPLSSRIRASTNMTALPILIGLRFEFSGVLTSTRGASVKP